MASPNYGAPVLINTHVEELLVPVTANLFQALVAMERAKRFGLPPGLVIVVDADDRLKGVITDGDVRQALVRGQTGQVSVRDVMAHNPVFVRSDVPLTGILDDVRRQLDSQGRNSIIKHPILVDEDNRVVGIIDVSKLMLAQAWHWDKVAVVGLGYVGLTLAVSLAETGFHVVGWDTSARVRSDLRRGISHVYERGLEALLSAQIADRRLTIADSESEIRDCHIYIIAVSTPVHDSKPNLTYLKSAIEATAPYLQPGDLVILRSTVPVGTCRGLVKTAIESLTSLNVGPDISVAFAPERTVEGRALDELRTLPQIIGGFDQWSLESASRIFNRLTPTVVQMKSLEEAELVKLINNSSRDLSFAFANEIALICETYNQDAFRIIEAANLGYPRNPIALPSPGVGGSCLKKDPYLFANLCPPGLPDIVTAARHVNEIMPTRVTDRMLEALAHMGKSADTCDIFILGFAFKGEPETTDLRDSPTVQLVEQLRGRVRKIYGYDFVVPSAAIENIGVEWCSVEDGFSQSDAVLVMNNHRNFNKLDIYTLTKSMKAPAIVFDGWRLFNGDEIEKIPGVRYMGLGYLTPWNEAMSQGSSPSERKSSVRAADSIETRR